MNHSDAAKIFLKNATRTQWHDEALWFVRAKRDLQKNQITEWETLRARASAIKEHTLSHLDDYLKEFEKNAISNGILVHWAVDAEEHNQIVFNILQKADVRKLIKSKSMLTEECQMNPNT